jgi:hypothetical protein
MAGARLIYATGRRRCPVAGNGMRFEYGDETDRRLVQSLQHEYMRCRDAFGAFVLCAPSLIDPNGHRTDKYFAYNAYARLIHHLYEFLMGCASRRQGDTRPLRAEQADRLVTDHLQRILTARRRAILAGQAPSWENGLEAYPETAPSDFASSFRRHRNVALAHVAPDRSVLDLSDFYSSSHRYLVMMLEDASFAWGPRGGELPDLGAITAFSIGAPVTPVQG